MTKHTGEKPFSLSNDCVRFRFVNLDTQEIVLVHLPLSAYYCEDQEKWKIGELLLDAEKKMLGDDEQGSLRFLDLDRYLEWTSPTKVLKTRFLTIGTVKKSRKFPHNIKVEVKRVPEKD